MTKKEFEYRYGKTKLDHALSYLCEAIEKIAEFSFLVFFPLGIIEQVVIYGQHNPEQVIPVLLGLMALMCVGAAYQIDKLIKERKEKK